MVKNVLISKWLKRITELFNDGLITEEQRQRLNELIASQDQESANVAKMVMGKILREVLSQPLNDGQKKSFYEMLDFFEDPQADFMVLKGYGGTGKTFLLKSVLKYLVYINENVKIALSAPTNKAVKVLMTAASINEPGESKFEDVFDNIGNITFSTVHKLLALKQVISEEGDVSYKEDKYSPARLSDFNYFFVDESSMLSDELFTSLTKPKKKPKIVFIGDPCQIPPVKQKDSIPFRENYKDHTFQVTELTEIMRQKSDNPIINFSIVIRDNITETQPLPKLCTILNNKGEGLTYFDSDKEKSKIKPFLKQMFDSSQYRNNSDYIKVIAWRNKTIDYINKTVREMLYGANADSFIPGEVLIATSPVCRTVKGKKGVEYLKTIIATSEECIIRNVSIGTQTISGTVYKTWALDVETDDGIEKVHIIHEDDRANFEKHAENFKNLARRNYSLWPKYFALLKKDASLTYSYGISAHKSQGSTYENVLILEDDIDMNPDIIERNRIKYTAYSRASKRLYVLRKNYA